VLSYNSGWPACVTWYSTKYKKEEKKDGDVKRISFGLDGEA